MENGIVVRKAEKEDVRQIAEILVEDWQKAYRGIMDDAFLDSMNVDQRYEIEVKRYQKYVVATDGHEILGYAWLEQTEDEAADCEIIALYVRYAKRKNGIGKLLMQYAVRYFRESGRKRMIIWCLKENDESRRFYEKVGGKEFQTGSHNWGGKEYEMISYLYDLGYDEVVKKQYTTADRLNTRISIHSKYSTNKQGFGNWIISHYQIRDGMSVLELGCGTGDMWVHQSGIISRCSRFVLSDFSEGMLNQAKENLHSQTGIEYRIIDIQDIPFSDQTFDVVIANMMLYHVPDLQKGLREVRRVLKKDGVFYCATYGENGMMEYICSLFAEYHIQNQVNDSFTLQSGEKKLKAVFSDVRKLLYQDSLEVTDVEDMVDYIFSLTGMTDLQKLPREEVRSVLARNMPDGILHVPKEYGLFISHH